MRMIVAGGRDFTAEGYAFAQLDHITQALDGVVVVSGMAPGADHVGIMWAQACGHSVDPHPADWDTFGKSAGYRRNAEMAEVADMLVAFWDGKSRGTKHMIDLATKRGLIVQVIPY